MGRGRPASYDTERLLLELLLIDEDAILTRHISNELGLSNERIRQLYRELENQGYVVMDDEAKPIIYTLTTEGREYISAHLRENV